MISLTFAEINKFQYNNKCSSFKLRYVDSKQIFYHFLGYFILYRAHQAQPFLILSASFVVCLKKNKKNQTNYTPNICSGGLLRDVKTAEKASHLLASPPNHDARPVS